MPNKDQVALARWITVGLGIKEVRALHGDSGYLFNNMIAKYASAMENYSVSVEAENLLLEQGVKWQEVYTRGRFYCRGSSFMYEHAIPASIIRNQLLQVSQEQRISFDAVVEELDYSSHVVVVLRRPQNDKLKACGLNARMPDGWRWGDDPFDRYTKAEIAISKNVLKVKGAIMR